jgi:hypothetical protein
MKDHCISGVDDEVARILILTDWTFMNEVLLERMSLPSRSRKHALMCMGKLLEGK